MRYHKRDVWKAGIAIAGMVLLLLLMTWVPLSAASAHEGTSGLATPGTVAVQATPTANPTTIAVETAQEQLTKLQHDNDRSWQAWFWNNAATLIAVGGGIFAVIRWLDELEKERMKHDEERQANLQKQEKERFESLSSVITGLQDEKVGASVAAAIMLRMIFLRPGYEQFYEQAFALAVDNLRTRYTDPDTPEPINTLCRTLVTVFTKAFVLSRNRLMQENPGFSPQSLDAMQVHLDNMYLANVDLKQVWMPKSHLSKACLCRAKLSKANLSEADLSEANLEGANLEGANLEGANLTTATLTRANPEAATSLKGTKMSGVVGLTASQSQACAHAGAIFDSI